MLRAAFQQIPRPLVSGLPVLNGISPSNSSIFRPSLIMEQAKRWATKKMGSSKARQKRRPPGKRLGLKKYPGEYVEPGNIIVRQHGLKNHPGKNVAVGADHSLYAQIAGYIHITRDTVRDRTFINVMESKPESNSIMEHTREYSSKLAGGWRNDEIFTRDSQGNRICTLVNLKSLPPVQPHDLAAVNFDPMAAHLKQTGFDSVLLAMPSNKQ